MASQQAEELEGLSRSEVLRASPRMFDSDLLDKLSRVHPAVPPILFGPVIAFLLVDGLVHGVGLADVAWLLGGYLFWTLTEYWLHRIVFHFEPEDGIGARLHWIIHGVHHDHPNDPMRLVMPPSVSVPLAALFVFVFYVVLGSPAFLPFGAGFLGGYLAYDMLHYHVHHHRPKTALGKPAARAAHAPPLPEPRARLRRQRAVLGPRLRHRAEATSPKRRPPKRRGRDSNPRSACTDSSFQDWRIRPLCHPSGSARPIVAASDPGEGLFTLAALHWERWPSG